MNIRRWVRGGIEEPEPVEAGENRGRAQGHGWTGTEGYRQMVMLGQVRLRFWGGSKLRGNRSPSR